MTLGERITSLRKRCMWTQDDFGKMVGVHGRHVSRWERNLMKPSARTLSRIAEAFNVSADELLQDNGSREDAKPIVTDPFLLKIFHQVEQLDPEDKATLVKVAQAFITKTKVEKALKPEHLS